MTYHPISGFGSRRLTGAIVDAATNQNEPRLTHVNKWEIFRELCQAQAHFGVSDRELAVLNALLSFHPHENLADRDRLIVFPSNATLCMRAHGMAESTLRRHMARLVSAGLVLRRDSPNGKRFARGSDAAFGFDLRPLLVRADEIATHASNFRRAQAETKALREKLMLIRRDVTKLATWGRESAVQGSWDEIEDQLALSGRMLRRKLADVALVELLELHENLLTQVKAWLVIKTEEVIGNDAQIERHHHNSNTNTLDSEPALEKAKGEESEPSLPLFLVLKACTDFQSYCPTPPKTWAEFAAATEPLRPMMGISQEAWIDAQSTMGKSEAAICLAAILGRFDQIKSPGGYLRALTKRAADGKFSTGPMVMALLSKQSEAA